LPNLADKWIVDERKIQHQIAVTELANKIEQCEIAWNFQEVLLLLELAIVGAVSPLCCWWGQHFLGHNAKILPYQIQIVLIDAHLENRSRLI
jgi:hypothetical protein